MKFYYLSSVPNNEGHFEIHHRECSDIPTFHDRIYLGPFNNSVEALIQSLKTNTKSVVCKHCQEETLVTKFSGFKDSKSRFHNS